MKTLTIELSTHRRTNGTPMQTETPTYAPPRLVDQAILHEVGGPRPGDCLRAAMATIMDRSLLEVPHFVETPGEGAEWWAELVGFVRRVSLGTHTILCYDADEWPEGVNTLDYGVVLTGPSPRGDFHHAVVADPATLSIVHDPHPSRAGLLGKSQVYALVRKG